jgi:hypothetical protein
VLFRSGICERQAAGETEGIELLGQIGGRAVEKVLTKTIDVPSRTFEKQNRFLREKALNGKEE